MFETNPFSALFDTISPTVMQAFVLSMIALVVAGTLFDLAHKKSARYFFENARRNRGTRTIGTAEKVSLVLKTALVDWLAAGEFCNSQRRIAHLLTMYGFLAYIVATVAMVFGHPETADDTPVIWPLLWHLGALLVFIGGCWFWLLQRVDVAAEGRSRFRVVRADLFILALLANVTAALIWSYLLSDGRGGWSNIALGLYLTSAMILFGSVPWSKFSHMFYKPAAAFQKRVEDANGSRANLPLPVDAPATLGSARTPPANY
ncbi:MAG: adenylyl-sulfate reductase [Alphaproteobacteria bacterium]|nr:adenylyl-sulfate reductase [Alphaproteobacteria bacterium]MBV9692676.1 adenylyl-sulfate reductase [Alphaproteobacteria bacterium]